MDGSFGSEFKKFLSQPVRTSSPNTSYLEFSQKSPESSSAGLSQSTHIISNSRKTFSNDSRSVFRDLTNNADAPSDNGNANSSSLSEVCRNNSKSNILSNCFRPLALSSELKTQISYNASMASKYSFRPASSETYLSSSTRTAFLDSINAHDSLISKHVNTKRAHSFFDHRVNPNQRIQNMSMNGSFGVGISDSKNNANKYDINRSASAHQRRESFSSLDASFERVVASTPIHSFAIDYSVTSSPQEGPLNLSTNDRPLCLVLPKAIAPQKSYTSPLDLRADKNRNMTVRNVSSRAVDEFVDGKEGRVDGEKDFRLPFAPETEELNVEPREPISESTDGNPGVEDNDSDNEEEEHADGDPSLLTNLTMYEYFQKYQTLVSDDDSEGNSDDAVCADELRKRSVEKEHTDLSPKRLCHSSGELMRNASKETSNISIHGLDNLEKEAIQMKGPKPQLRILNKRRKEKGLQYTRQDGTIIPARAIKPPCNCKRLCSNKYSETTRAQLLSSFLKLKISGQNQFIDSHMSVVKTARPKVVNSRRAYSRAYYLPAVEGSVRVCKEMFMATLDIRDRKIRTIAAKKLAGAGIAADDGRLKNESRLTVSAEHMAYIKNHMLSFPAYTSHYSRAKTDRLYLSSDLNVTKMHQLYQEKCCEQGLVPVAYNTYRIIFNSMNLSFRKPKNDTCDVCDKLRVAIKTEINDVEKTALEKLQEDHQHAAQRVYDEKRRDIQRTKLDCSFRVVSFDLQKQLPTPFLTCGRTFYSRQLYTLNLTLFVSCFGQNSAVCYIWDETKARRGSQEIGSCLIKDLLSLPTEITEVTYYSDRCGGQNLNKNIVFMFSFMIENFAERGRPLTVLHKFMKTGHSHMEVDSIHAAIERTKKKSSIDIETPRDWVVLIASVRRSIPFKVLEMEQKEFKSIKELSSRYHVPRCNERGELLKFKEIMVFRYSTEHPRTVQYKNDVEDDGFEMFKLTTAENIPEADSITLLPIENHPIPLPAAKIADLRNLMPYIKQKQYYSAFLKSLQEPKRGRKPKNCFEDHFDADVYDCSESDEED